MVRPPPRAAVAAPPPVVVTGLGPVSAIGCGADDFWSALLAGVHGFGPITLCDAAGSASKVAAEVRDFRLSQFLPSGRALERRTTRPAQLALAAGALALEEAGLTDDGFDRDRVGVCVGTSVGNLGDGFAARDRWRQGTERLRPDGGFCFFNHSAACQVSAYFDLRGPVLTVTTGCNSGLDAVGQGLRLIETGQADAVLTVGTDCEVIPEMLAVLNACGALSTRYNDEPGRASRPFDVERDGNVIGEGAAAVLLESAAHAERRGCRALARVAGHAVCAAGRGRSYSASDPDLDLRPAVRALRGAIDQAGWAPGEVGGVSANGSASVRYDVLEARVLGELLGDALPAVPVHSIKSMLGQNGAGSSALQVVAACLAIDRGCVPPTINHTTTDPGCGALRVVTVAEPLGSPRLLVHSIGFGGFYYSGGAFEAPNGQPTRGG